MEFIVGVTGVAELLPNDGPCLDRGSLSMLECESRLGDLSEIGCPQPASPAGNIRFRSSAVHDRWERDACLLLFELAGIRRGISLSEPNRREPALPVAL